MLAELILWVITTALSALLAPRPQVTTPTPGQVNIPVVAPDTPIAVLFGTRMIDSPNVVWYGDVRTTPIMSQGGGKK